MTRAIIRSLAALSFIFSLTLLTGADRPGEAVDSRLIGATPRPAAPAPARNLRLYATTLKIPTYQYQSALYGSEAEDSIYPYPRLDFDRIGPPVLTSYQAIVIENPYLSVTVLPSLGGRIYRIRDRLMGRDITYHNPVIKPTRWGARGWWLATGGIEWAFPTEEHGLIEWRPWEYETRQTLDQVSVLVHDHEDRTGLLVWVKISLDSSHAYLTIQPGINNPTPAPQVFQFWLNGMLSLNNNGVLDRTRFIVPTSTIQVHSTSDAGLPGPGSAVSWPIFENRDLSLLRNWHGYMGFFANPSAQADFAGAYDESTDRGVVRVFPHEVATGVKFFMGKSLDPDLWTDDASSYFEMWGGVTPTFWDTTTLGPGQSVAWRERWYPVSGLHGAFNYADDLAAVRLVVGRDRIQIGIAPTQLIDGKVILWLNGAQVAAWRTVFQPGRAFIQTWAKPEGETGNFGLSLVDRNGHELAKYGEGVPP